MALLVVAPVFGFLWWADRRRRAIRYGALLGLGLVVAWLGAVCLALSDVAGAGGFVDCNQSCSLWEETVGMSIVVLPVMLVALLLGLTVTALLRRGDRRFD